MKICVVSRSPIADDPRVRRQIDSLMAAGHEVTAFGFPARHADEPAWPVHPIEWPTLSRIGRVLEVARLIAARVGLGWVAFRSSRRVRRMERKIAEVDADLFHAHDWVSLGVAFKASRRRRALLAYDSHEFASGEYTGSPLWFVRAPMIREVEGRGLSASTLITTVSEGLADRLAGEYHLPVRPLVLRSVPPFDPGAEHPVRTPIEFLYHGAIAPQRGLEELIDSLPLWHRDRLLVLRGPGTSDYVAYLRERAADLDVSDRVRFDDPVPLPELIAAASQSDVGIFALPDSNPQADFVLPNKLFEYLMAGLAVVVTNQSEMAAVVDRYGVGVTLDRSLEARLTADLVNAMDHEKITKYRAAARRAATDLCWDREQQVLLDAYDAMAAR